MTFGLPSEKEHVITQPLTPEEVALTIQSACNSPKGSDSEFTATSPHCMLHQVGFTPMLTSSSSLMMVGGGGGHLSKIPGN